MSSPLVSVVLPTYNREDYLPHAIESVVGQTYDLWELIIWDDGSQDGTRDVVNSYDDHRISYHSADNRGQSYALNQALRLAKGKYVAFLDDDDRWYPEKLSLQVTIMERHWEVDLLFSDFWNVNLSTGEKGMNSEQHSAVFEELELKEISSGVCLVSSGIPEQLLASNFVLPSSTITRRAVCQMVGDFNVQLRNAMDLEYWWRAALAGAQFAYVDEVLLDRIKPPDSLSSNSVVTQANHIKALDSCFEEAVAQGRDDLIPYLQRAYLVTWHRTIRLHAFLGERRRALLAFKQSLQYGITWRAVYLLVGAMLGPGLATRISRDRQTDYNR